ncbi:TonB-dependent receptor [Dysgonomonas sp. 520]|uniref:TonB-dependent receptor n=1 Tax=Dysgonomonas sp. 520 TaxID=2302931 RepID=UPI0013D0BB96|nr:TonB-dependent receptor [Dysgonomonas sp. 520]NDW08592.1 TonB-dependent receptor [Dysgonomonas sp. 520]
MFLSRAFCTILFLPFCLISLSQNKLDSLQHLNEVVVVGNKYKEVIPSQKLSGKELENLNTFSVADAIRYFSGIQLKDYGGIGGLKTVDIRSMGTNHTAVFYDGIQVVNAQNGQVDLGKFSMENVEEISLYNGQKSDIFQSAKDYASAGSIYIRSRRPRFEGRKKTNLKASFKTGSFDLANPSILWEQKITDKISTSFHAEYLNSSGKYKFRYRKVLDGLVAWDTTAVRQNGDIEAFRLEAGLNGFTDRNGKWNVKAYYYDSERGIPGAIVNNIWKFSQRQWDRNFFVQGSFQEQITDRYEFQVNAKYGHDYLRYLNPDTTLMLINNEYKQQDVYLSAVNKYRITSWWDASLAIDYQWNMLDADLRDFVHPKRHTVLAALATAFDWNRLKGQASLLGTFVFDKVTRIQHNFEEGQSLPNVETGTPDNKQELTPAIFLSYQPFESHDFNIRAFYKRIFRMPTFNDLYYTEVGNIALKPEYTTQYNAGFQYIKTFPRKILKSIGLQTDSYFIKVKNKIVCNPKGSALFRAQTYNIGFVEILGIDVSAKAEWLFPFGIQVNTNVAYTYQKARDFSEPGEVTYGGQIPYIPWHSASAFMNATYKTWSFNYSFIYVGERYDNSDNKRANYHQPWYTHDLGLGKEFRIKSTRLKLSAEVNNLFDQQYDVVINYPMPGRNYKLSLKLEI